MGRGTPQSPAREWGQRMLSPPPMAPGRQLRPVHAALKRGTHQRARRRPRGARSHSDPGSEHGARRPGPHASPAPGHLGGPFCPGGGRLLHCHLHTPLGRRERWNHLPNMQKRREESVSQENAAGRGPLPVLAQLGSEITRTSRSLGLWWRREASKSTGIASSPKATGDMGEGNGARPPARDSGPAPFLSVCHPKSP